MIIHKSFFATLASYSNMALYNSMSYSLIFAKFASLLFIGVVNVTFII